MDRRIKAAKFGLLKTIDSFEKLEFTPARKVKVDENGMTIIPRVFAGGDIVNLNSDAVTAIADAKIALEGIHKMFCKK